MNEISSIPIKSAYIYIYYFFLLDAVDIKVAVILMKGTGHQL